MLHGYVSPIEYTKDSIFRDQNFGLIQQTLRFYDDLLADVFDTLFPQKENLSKGIQCPPKSFYSITFITDNVFPVENNPKFMLPASTHSQEEERALTKCTWPDKLNRSFYII